MASSSSRIVESEEVQLKSLIEAFCSVCSLEDIALAYSNAGHNVERAGEILCAVKQHKISAASRAYNYETSFKHAEESSQMENPDNSILLSKASSVRKPKRISASVGSVSGLLGNTYFRPTSSLKQPSEAAKPLKLNAHDPSVSVSRVQRYGSEPLVEKVILDNSLKQASISNTDVEEFLFSMLGDGFQLSLDNIRQVLGNCGYDAKQGMDELLSLSAKKLDIGKAVDHNLHRTSCSNKETSCYGGECKEFQLQRGYSNETSNLSEKKSNLSREVLESWFSNADGFEEEPKVKRLEWGLNRTRVTGQKPVTKPFDEDELFQATLTEMTQPDIIEDNEEEYQLLRKAAKQQWDTMKLYHAAAVDAFTKGDHAQTKYCLEQGKQCFQKAQEANEKSSCLILEKAAPDETGDELPLDLHAQSVRESIRLLKLHLLSLANISSFSYLKVTINNDGEDTAKGKRKMKKVLQLLEDESIKWSEVEGRPGTIMIPLHEVNPDTLSFGIDS